ncbi:TRAP transporter solute binding subunit DctP [Oleiphilus messinensis]|uniref:TRAP transporter solute binding subunit DctP n=1 Tax=Oleiphilus messinensis TaxID=141451 RepID=A0A1Y0IFM1_9GAMM|nr:putative solute-binding protein [Oleiphilus messinensis]ARU59322.1 TRAP transporter solute binding subunit DctP [Oleiphilus messinensis]
MDNYLNGSVVKRMVANLASVCLILFVMPAQSEPAMSLGSELIHRSFCVWDPVGRDGPVVTTVKEAVTRAVEWGIELEIEAYTDEKVAALDFKAGRCDGVIVTDVSTREFNKFTSTFNAVGAIPGEQELRTILKTLTTPKAAQLMREGHYEVVGILPLGTVFAFVRDRTINSADAFQGRKMAVLNSDPVATQLVRRVGGSVVNTSITNFAGLFNNGSVDIVFAPAVAYKTLELYKGLESGGGIINYPFLNTSLQIIIRHDRFPEGFGQKMREYSLTKLDALLDLVQQAEREIPSQYWISLAGNLPRYYDEYMRQSRIDLKKEGYYEPRALKLMKKVRCKYSPSHGECVQNDE